MERSTVFSLFIEAGLRFHRFFLQWQVKIHTSHCRRGIFTMFQCSLPGPSARRACTALYASKDISPNTHSTLPIHSFYALGPEPFVFVPTATELMRQQAVIGAASSSNATLAIPAKKKTTDVQQHAEYRDCGTPRLTLPRDHSNNHF